MVKSYLYLKPKSSIMEYNFKEIESNWQKYWATNKTFAAKDGGDKQKYYVLDMFPVSIWCWFLDVGHPLGYIASDIVFEI